MKSIVENFPTKYSYEYYHFPRFFRLQRLEFLVDIVKKMNPSNILDVGCSDGIFLHCLQTKAIKLYGIDNREGAIKNACKINSQMHFEISNAEKMPFRDNTFDVVVCFETLEHVHNFMDVIDEIIRVSRRFFVISVPIETGVKGIIKNIGRKMLSRENSHYGFNENKISRYIDSQNFCEIQKTRNTMVTRIIIVRVVK